MILRLLIILLVAGSVLGQNGARIQRHRLYESNEDENFQKIKRRRLTVDVDSTGIALYAWGQECFFKINLLQRMLINPDYYEQGTYNGHPYIKYGNNRFRFRMYENAMGRFEFDAVIRSKPANGRHKIPFNIATQGLRFYYQDSVLVNPPFADSPPEVWNSYAVYHNSRKHNGIFINGPDTTYQYYGTGKAFHIYRPKVWDAAGDTVWGFIQIDIDASEMIIGVDSLWLHDTTRVWPVKIDPSFGRTDVGGTGITVTEYRHYALWAATYIGTPGAATIDNAQANCFIISPDGANNVRVNCWTKEAAVADCDLLASSAITDINNTTNQWNTLVMSGTLSAGQDYMVSVAGEEAADNRLRIMGDAVLWGDIKILDDTDLIPPADLTGATDNNANAYSVFINYTVTGEAAPSGRRKKMITGGN